MSVVPRFHTPRDTRYRSLGSKICRMSSVLGRPSTEWQIRANDVIGEVDDDGLFRYPLVIVSVQRQVGKTATALTVAAHRALFMRSSKIWYTAQTGAIARERFIEDLATPATLNIPQLVSLKRGAGDTRLSIPARGSQIRPHPPTEQYLHGEQSDLNIIDECWSFTELEAKNLMQAIVPTQNTRRNAQTIMLSTAGTQNSTWWNRQLEAAKEGRPGVALIDYGVPPDEDPTDIATAIKYHPGVGNIINERAIYSAYEQLDSPNEFARCYSNIPTIGSSSLFEESMLDAVATSEPIPHAARVHLCLAVGRDLEEAALVAVADSEGSPVVEVIDARPGVSWLASEAIAVSRAQRLPIVVDRLSPASSLIPELEAAGVEVITPTTRDITTATLEMMKHLREATIRLRTDEELLRELRGVRTREMGDGALMWSRKYSATPIPRLEAATLGLWAMSSTTTKESPKIWIPA